MEGGDRAMEGGDRAVQIWQVRLEGNARRQRPLSTLSRSREGGTGCGPTLGVGRVSQPPGEVAHLVEIALPLGSLLCHQTAV